MLIKDLIEKLKELDGDLGVVLCSNGSISSLDKVILDGDHIFLEGEIKAPEGGTKEYKELEEML